MSRDVQSSPVASPRLELADEKHELLRRRRMNCLLELEAAIMF
jgi:hypothetical protein